MANAFYKAGLDALATAGLDWDTTTLGVALMNDTYTFDRLDALFSDIDADQIGSVVAPSGQGYAAEVASLDDTEFTGISAALTVGAVVVFIDTGGGDGPLFAYFDTGVGFPLTTDGSNVVVRWNNSTPSGDVWGW